MFYQDRESGSRRKGQNKERYRETQRSIEYHKNYSDREYEVGKTRRNVAPWTLKPSHPWIRRIWKSALGGDERICVEDDDVLKLKVSWPEKRER